MLMRIACRAVGIGFLGALLFLTTAGGDPRPANATDLASSKPPLAATPWMGWNTWYSFGSNFNQGTIQRVADSLISGGYAAKGYRLVWLDAGWWHGIRRANGSIQIDPAQWPHGMKGLVDYLHARGLEAGIYTDAGRDGCAGPNTGSYG